MNFKEADAIYSNGIVRFRSTFPPSRIEREILEII